MHRRGHVGMAMLAYAPVGYLLLRDSRVGLALVGFLGVLTVEPLPDNDFWIPGLRHRGTSHSLLCALVVGGVIGAVGWAVGEHLTLPLATALAGLDTAQVGIFAGILGWTADQLRALDGRALAVFGFAVGAFGIIVHLLADIITIGGIRPFLPLSRRRVSLSSLHADSPVANNALFGLGVLTLAVVLFTTAPGVGFAAPADLSPIGVAAGVSGNQTQNASRASVVFENQTTNGSTVVVERATLPEGGFVVLHSAPLGEAGSLEESMVAVSPYLKPGTHRNITLRVRHSPPGGLVNKTKLSDSGDYSVALYRDTNTNRRFDYITSGRRADTPYIVGSGSTARFAADAAHITVPQSRTPMQSASIQFADQRTSGTIVMIRSVTLPDGGFVVVHSERYLRGGDPVRTAIGLSRYLPPGTYHNVVVVLVNGSVQQNQTLVAIPSRDTNGNKTYDYVRSEGFQDVPYTADGEIVADRASVTVPSTSSSTPETETSARATTAARETTRATTVTMTATATTTATATATATATPTPTLTPTPASTPTPTETTQPATGGASNSGSGGGGWLAENRLIILVGAVIVGGYLLLRPQS